MVRVFTHDAIIYPGLNEFTLQYPSGPIDMGEFRVCVSDIFRRKNDNLRT